ncbi:MAG TPA: TonB-dependent receptor [Cytophagales bacterium]|nr:TonB-dependent receptor [Cytophagales bacterium]
MEELMNIEVTSVSKRPEKLTEVASAIQIITQEDIRRSGATSLPEALRLAPNLQVAQLNSYAWIISARGFNALYSNKLLVMIDGRTVYSPLFAGVFWDAQSVVLEDVDRIEVISGPGGTLWGANAVNGVINIITKNASKTQGLYVSAAAGTYLKDMLEARYGGKIGSNFFYRVYAQHSDRNRTFLPDGEGNKDKWGLTQSGFQLEWNASDKNTVSVQGNFYGGKEKTTPMHTSLDGQNVLAQWNHDFSEKSKLIVQAYFDRTWRRMPSISNELETYDLDIQHNFLIGERHNVLWGAEYRLRDDHTLNYTTSAGILPNRRKMDLFSGFVQDEITLMPDHFKFTLGTKFSHNIFTGFEIQPSARLAWTPNEKHTVWGAVSRAVRTPSRIDVDYYIPTNPSPGSPQVAGGPNFDSEKLIAYELGYRLQPQTNISLALATFYNQYDDLYSVEALPGTKTYQIQNGTKGSSMGTELSGTYQVGKRWRLRGGYTYFYKKLEDKPGHTFDPTTLGFDAKNRFLLQSFLNLPWNFQCDITTRYTDNLSSKAPEYFTFDARLAWLFKHWEISVVGQNLWENRHLEYAFEIPRSVYGKISCRF